MRFWGCSHSPTRDTPSSSAPWGERWKRQLSAAVRVLHSLAPQKMRSPPIAPRAPLRRSAQKNLISAWFRNSGQWVFCAQTLFPFPHGRYST